MGRRRGRTGPGGAVVSSLSQNAGGTVRPKGDSASQHTLSKRGKGRQREDEELNRLANLPSRAHSSQSTGAPPSSAASASSSSSSSSWLGKSPQQMLREWCSSNSRKSPTYVHCYLHHYLANSATAVPSVMSADHVFRFHRQVLSN